MKNNSTSAPRSGFSRYLGLLLGVLAGVSGPAWAARPNVILIMTDDQGYGDLSATGNPILRTPNTDRIAAEGVSLTRFYVSPVCTPTRAALMTGRYNFRTRAIDTYIGRAMMEPAEVTVAELLRDAGYATGIFGKWHLGDCYPIRTIDQGFSESLVHRGGGLRQPSNPPDGDKYFNPILEHNGKPVRKKGYCTDIYFDAALKFIGTQHKARKPFFAYIPTNAPHDPFDEVPAELYEHYKPLVRNDRDARIFAMIANIDQNIGRVLQRLDELKIANDTIVIYMHDNGPAGDRYNAGLRGQKGSIFEGGIRSPFFVRWPAALQAGLKRSEVAAHIDVMPTILQACGVQPPATIRFDGRSLVPLLTSDRNPWHDRTLFAQWHRGDVPVLHHNFAAVTQRWKLLHNTNAGRETLEGELKLELFDLLADPGETKNVAADHPEVVADLKSRYEAWFTDVGATRTDNYAPPRIILGHRDTEPVVLTPQDIRADTGAGWWVKGGWLVHVEEARDYTIRLRFREPVSTTVTARLKVNDVERQATVQSSVREYTFTRVPLPAGDAKVQAFLEGGKNPTDAVYQVDVTW